MKISIYRIEKLNFEPTIEEMKAFGINYSKDEWDFLCKNKKFLELFTLNLPEAEKEAYRILFENDNK